MLSSEDKQVQYCARSSWDNFSDLAKKKKKKYISTSCTRPTIVGSLLSFSVFDG